jgi:hypothetical protein
VKNKDIKFLFMNGRHITLSFWLSTVPRVSPLWGRMWTIHSSSGNRTWRTGKFSMILRMFATFDDQVMDQCTNNYECLVIDNTSSSNSLTDQVFWYKAEPQSDFKMCNPAFWKLVLSWKKPWTLEELYDLDKIRKSKNHESRSSRLTDHMRN